jgi:hypothetical protein
VKQDHDVLKEGGIRLNKNLYFRLKYDLPIEKTIAKISSFIKGPANPDAIFFATNYLDWLDWRQ